MEFARVCGPLRHLCILGSFVGTLSAGFVQCRGLFDRGCLTDILCSWAGTHPERTINGLAPVGLPEMMKLSESFRHVPTLVKHRL